MNDFDAIDQSLEIESTKISSEIISGNSSNLAKSPKKGDSESDYDYDYTRGQLYSLIEKGQEAIDGILECNRRHRLLNRLPPKPKFCRWHRNSESAASFLGRSGWRN